MIKKLANFLDLEGLSEFNIPEFILNLAPYNKIVYDNVFGYCLQYKQFFKFRIPITNIPKEDQLKLLNHLKTPTLKNCLLQLNRAGWSLLIDSRWEDDIKTLLKESFPNISDELIQEVLNIVIV